MTDTTLWGPGEVCGRFDVSRATFKRWRAEPDFPQPIAELLSGPVWDAQTVRAWHKARAIRARERGLEPGQSSD